MSQKNPSLELVQDALGELIDGLHAAKAGLSDPDKIIAINNELIETTHRITMVGALIFHQQTTAIADAANRVADASKDVQAAIKELNNLKDFIKSVSGFLGLVDELIDLAKMAI